MSDYIKYAGYLIAFAVVASWIGPGLAVAGVMLYWAVISKQIG